MNTVIAESPVRTVVAGSPVSIVVAKSSVSTAPVSRGKTGDFHFVQRYSLTLHPKFKVH